ncbi:MAG: S1 RNA-binding domain-containing protein [Succinivibrionaceae bacterium]|nr:S1 RNA-binding domain-containing protein [Succinivibrionaceae bacterium]MDY6376444.1 S1 RNA-binding domain-containing protein [Succinivibrionaceae bacterium]
MDPIVKSFKYGQQTINLETGAAVKGAGTYVVAGMDDTSVLASVVKGGSGFRVTFESRRSSLGRKAERTAAVIRRESEIGGVVRRALLASFGDRLADEYEGYSVSVVLLSSNPEIPADLISIIAASAAAAAAGLPILAPFAAARVGLINGQFILNPVRSEIALSSLDLVVTGTAEGTMSAEGRAAEAGDSVIPAAVEFAQKAIAPAAAAIGEFAAAAGAAVPAAPDEAKEAELLGKFVKALTADAVKTEEGADESAAERQRDDALVNIIGLAGQGAVGAEIVAEKANSADPSLSLDPATAGMLSRRALRSIIRHRIESGDREDGRTAQMVAALSAGVGVIPRVHGSAFFTDGGIQALSVVTLDAERGAHRGECFTADVHTADESFDTGRISSFIRASILPVLPQQEGSLTYQISSDIEVIGTDGAVAVPSVTGLSLALMDAGVGVKSAAACVSAGIIGGTVLSDLTADELAAADVTLVESGTKSGVTAVMLSANSAVIPADKIAALISQARLARLHVLRVSSAALGSPRESVSRFAPQIRTINISPADAKSVVGKGGGTIRSISEESGAEIEVREDGRVEICAPDESSMETAVRRIHEITDSRVEVGQIFTGHVTRIVDFGAFVNILPGKDGLVHISQITGTKIKDVSEYLSVGDEVRVKVMNIDSKNRIALSIKAAKDDEEGTAEAPETTAPGTPTPESEAQKAAPESAEAAAPAPEAAAPAPEAPEEAPAADAEEQKPAPEAALYGVSAAAAEEKAAEEAAPAEPAAAEAETAPASDETPAEPAAEQAPEEPAPGAGSEESAEEAPADAEPEAVSAPEEEAPAEAAPEAEAPSEPAADGETAGEPKKRPVRRRAPARRAPRKADEGDAKPRPRRRASRPRSENAAPEAESAE